MSAIFGLIFLLLDQYLKHSGLSYTINTGSVLGLAIPNFQAALIHLLVVSGLALYILANRKDRAFPAAVLAFMIIISFSNFADRLTAGGVIDYWPAFGFTFNLTDLLLSTTILILVANYIYKQWTNRKQ